jgi:hypothetical protein
MSKLRRFMPLEKNIALTLKYPTVGYIKFVTG